MVPVGVKVRAKTQPNPDSNPDPDPKPQPKRAKTAYKRGAAFASIQEISQLIADDDSEVQTALRNFQVKNTPKDPFSLIAKPTQHFCLGRIVTECLLRFLIQFSTLANFFQTSEILGKKSPHSSSIIIYKSIFGNSSFGTFGGGMNDAENVSRRKKKDRPRLEPQRKMPLLILRGTIVHRAYGIHKNLPVYI